MTASGKPAARRPQRDEVVDVLIIGAGPSGSVAAKHLSAAGFSVVTLEQGHMPDRDLYPGRRPEWELVSQKRWHPNPNVRDLPRDYPVETSESDINPLMFAGVGGSATIYAGHWTPFTPSDFRVKTLDGIADDWPFTYEDLFPYLDQIEHEVGVSGFREIPPTRRAATFRRRRCQSARSAAKRPLVSTSSAGIGGRALMPFLRFPTTD